MELKLGLALPDPGHCKAFRREPCALLDGKRWFGVGEAVGATGGKLQAARPLSVRGGGETTDKRKRRLVRWPPVKCARLRGGACSGYVKVKKPKRTKRQYVARAWSPTRTGKGTDWLLVGDVPWEAFTKSVERLKILA